MPAVVECECGASYQLRDEFAGQRLQCPQCGRDHVAKETRSTQQADPVFERDKFLLRQKVLAISEKYHVSDDQNNPILFVERPAHFIRNVTASLSGVAVGGAMILLALPLMNKMTS